MECSVRIFINELWSALVNINDCQVWEILFINEWSVCEYSKWSVFGFWVCWQCCVWMRFLRWTVLQRNVDGMWSCDTTCYVYLLSTCMCSILRYRPIQFKPWCITIYIYPPLSYQALATLQRLLTDFPGVIVIYGCKTV